MPAFIAHILIADAVRERLKAVPRGEDPKGLLAAFVGDALDKYSTYMHLGAVGPDLPYYGGGVKSILQLMERGHNRPTGVDEWSYQLHSKEPNRFPLNMAEIIWKESDPTQAPDAEWEEEDERKFAFLCGFLTHVAADQTIHPLVNSIAGPYTKAADARKEHGNCEVHQDIYLLWKYSKNRTLTKQQLEEGLVQTRIDLSPEAWRKWYLPLPFRYLIQKAFVEAHAVTPTASEIQKWVRGLWWAQFACAKLPLVYKPAHKDLFTPEGQLKTDADAYKRYIDYVFREKRYDHYVEEAVKVASIYIKALLRLHENEIDSAARENFLKVVRSADLGAPLEEVNEAKVKKALDEWKE